MKRGIVILISLVVLGSLSAFPERTMNAGGSLSYSVTKLNPDADSSSEFTFRPQFGYFIMENLSADLLLGLGYGKEGDLSVTSFNFGLGGRYFFDQIYAGAGFIQEGYRRSFKGTKEHEYSATYIELKGGYIIPVVESVYVDLGINYTMGVGELGGDLRGTDNELTRFRFLAGMQFFF